MHPSALTILVLGVGGNVSQGILKALSISSLSCRVVGACVSPLAMGLYTVDRALVSPRADDPRFLDWLLETCRRERVRAILSGVEPVLEAIAPHSEEIRSRTGAVAIVSPPAVLAIAGDKLETCRWLEESGLAVPRYAASEDRESLERLVRERGFPLVAKPRRSKGSRGFRLLENEASLAEVAGRPGNVVQEYVGDASAEFTAGSFCDRNGAVAGTIVFRRELLEGTTYRAEAGDFPEIRSESVRIVERLRPTGPCNVQLRLSGGHAVSFEVNARFSGTTPIRARFGFNEVEAAIRHFVLDEPEVRLPVVTRGIALRYWNEIYPELESVDEIRRTGALDDPGARPPCVEDYGIGV